MGGLLPDTEFCTQVGLALACGGLIGLERQVRGKAAGLRTSVLVVLGTQVFIWLGTTVHGPSMDPTRVLGQVVAGVGFLGTGVILARGGTLIGVTTAAVVWILAAIGSLIGMGRYREAVSITLITFIVLAGVRLLDIQIRRLTGTVEVED